MQKVAIAIRDQIEVVDLIVTSPYIRAKQTADLVSQIFFDTKTMSAAELVPHSPPVAFVKWLKAHAGTINSVMAIGHEPHLSSLIGYLLMGEPRSAFEMKKSAVCCLEVTDFDRLGPACATMEWLIPPRFLAD
jgi:phosphohistidine phosphatase